MNFLVSVIVPVYKVEKFLPECVESIRKQTYSNIEIILVDDGSPDNCPQICDTYAQQDCRIRVIHKENGGLSDARNAGIDIAKGEYLCFVDSDDHIQPTMIENLLSAAVTNNVKLALSNLKAVDENGKRVFTADESPVKSGLFSASELLLKIYQNLGWYYIVAWNKLYHRSLFEQIRFPVGKIHEDEFVIAQIVCKAGNVVCIDSEEYIYVYQRTGSIMSSRQTQSQCDWLEALYKRFEFCKHEASLEAFTSETRAVYFRELNNLFLKKELLNGTTLQQRKKAKKQYALMKGKTRTERINWLIFKISPKLENNIVQKVRGMRG